MYSTCCPAPNVAVYFVAIAVGYILFLCLNRELKKLMSTSEVDLDEVRMMPLWLVYGIWGSD